MGHLGSYKVFVGEGLAIVAWFGNKGDCHYSKTETLVPRKDYASSSIICRGSFQMTEYPKECPDAWPKIKAGQMCNAYSPDFYSGLHKWEALEDNSLELCSGAVDDKGRPSINAFNYEQLHGLQTIKKGQVLIVATGQAMTDNMTKDSPYIIRAATKDIDLVLTGSAMKIWR